MWRELLGSTAGLRFASSTPSSISDLASVPDSGRFRLTLKCPELGFSALASGGLRARAAPLLSELIATVAQAASLGVLDGAEVVYVEQVQVDLGPHDLDRRVGSRTGAYAAALGHALPAWPSEDFARAAISATAGRDRKSLEEFVARALPPLKRISDTLSRAVLLTASAA